MRDLISEINDLKNSKIKEIIDSRTKDFFDFQDKPSREIFKELCFCLLTANYSAEPSIRIQKEINDGFLHLPEELLAKKLKSLGYRFPNTRAKFILNARYLSDNIKENLHKFGSDAEIRDWLVKNVKGIGMKEASHFLRNIGYKNVAIIDFHIIDLLVKNNLMKKPKSINQKKYLDIENILKEISKKTGLSLGELDLYLWYMETGKVLK